MHWFEQLSRLYGERDIPLFHEHVCCDILVDITYSGKLISAAYSRKILPIPVTERSSCRTVNIAPHPLCDTVQNLTEPRRKAQYLAYLSKWTGFAAENPMLKAVLEYISGNTLLQDLTRFGIKPLAHSTVRFSVCGSELCNDPEIIASHIRFTRSLLQYEGICCLSGEHTSLCRLHPKRITSRSSSAKLISKHERGRITCGGMFRSADEVFPVGLEKSFRAHAALKRLIAEGAVQLDNWCFIAFDETGNSLPLPLYCGTCKPAGNVTVLGFCEMTKGRLSVAFFRCISAEEYRRAMNTSAEKLPQRHSSYYYQRFLNRLL